MIQMTPDELLSQVPLELPVSPWRTVTQTMINAFADATGDHQWIHVDGARAADGPFGHTIAHGYLTVSLIPVLLAEVFSVRSPMGLNYGIDRLRLTAPVREGAQVRLRAKVLDALDRSGRIRYSLDVAVEIQGEDRPALVGTITYLAFP